MLLNDGAWEVKRGGAGPVREEEERGGRGGLQKEGGGGNSYTLGRVLIIDTRFVEVEIGLQDFAVPDPLNTPHVSKSLFTTILRWLNCRLLYVVR